MPRYKTSHKKKSKKSTSHGKKKIRTSRKRTSRKKLDLLKVRLSGGAFMLRGKSMTQCSVKSYIQHNLQVFNGFKFVSGGADYIVIPDDVKKPSTTALNANPNAEVVTFSELIERFKGCFGGDSQVELFDGSKLIKNIVAGDMVQVRDGFAKVLFSIKIEGPCEVVRLPSGLVISETHPIKVNGKWTKPHSNERHLEDCLYNFVLETSHAMVVNGQECITWGHENPDVYHPFYGSRCKIESALSKLPFRDNHVIINKFVRDDNGHVIGFL